MATRTHRTSTKCSYNARSKRDCIGEGRCSVPRGMAQKAHDQQAQWQVDHHSEWPDWPACLGSRLRFLPQRRRTCNTNLKRHPQNSSSAVDSLSCPPNYACSGSDGDGTGPGLPAGPAPWPTSQLSFPSAVALGSEIGAPANFIVGSRATATEQAPHLSPQTLHG